MQADPGTGALSDATAGPGRSAMRASPRVDCAYCHAPGGNVVCSGLDTRSNPWTWVACDACGAISLAPRPTSAQLAAAYDSSYYGGSEAKFAGPVERFIDLCRRARANRLAAGLPNGATVLDLGCGNGGFLAALGTRGSFTLHGIELEGGGAQRAARHSQIRLKTGVLEPGDFADGSLDLVTLFHVYEHLTEPRRTLDLIHRALKIDGRLVMSFPNISSLQARIFRGRWLHLDPPRHLFLFPSHAFERAMVSAGFVVKSRRHFSVEQNPFGFIQSTLNCMLRPRDLLYERLKGNVDYAPEHGALSILAQKVFAGLLLPAAVCLDALESALGLGATVEYTLTKATRTP